MLTNSVAPQKPTQQAKPNPDLHQDDVSQSDDLQQYRDAHHEHDSGRSNETVISETTISQMQQSFARMHQLSRDSGEVTWDTRLSRLNQLECMVNDHRDAIAEVISGDFGHRAVAETTMLEIFPTLEGIRYAKSHGKKWMQQQKVSTSLWFLPASSYIQPQPLGVVGIISPWNYPFYLVAGPLIAALVAGNRVMIKASEFAPKFEQWLADTIPQYFSPDEVAVVTGGVEVAQAFSQLPLDHLLFTGSTAVGRHIMRAAADNLTPVTLELGGKSPVIATPSMDMDKLVNRLWAGKCINAGQTCIAPDYLLIQEQHVAAFIERSKDWLAQHYPDIRDNPDYSHIINGKQFARVQGYLDEAQSSGASVYPLVDEAGDEATGFMPPYVVTNLPEQSQLLQEEIFAPILPVVTYKTLEDAIAYVNARPRPLALYAFAEDSRHSEQVMADTISGGACINDTIYHIAQEELPFGGVGASGMGNYHGKFGFDTFSHRKAVFKQSGLNFMGMLLPPYGALFDKMMKVVTR